MIRFVGQPRIRSTGEILTLAEAKGQNRGENQCVGKAAEPFDKEGDQRCEGSRGT